MPGTARAPVRAGGAGAAGPWTLATPSLGVQVSMDGDTLVVAYATDGALGPAAQALFLPVEWDGTGRCRLVDAVQRPQWRTLVELPRLGDGARGVHMNECPNVGVSLLDALQAGPDQLLTRERLGAYACGGFGCGQKARFHVMHSQS